MRIVQALGWYFPESLGGTEVYVSALAARLRAHGHEVHIAAPQPGLGVPRSYEHDGIPVYRYPIPADASRAEARGQTYARGASHFHAWLRAVRPDVVHMHTFVTGLGLHEIDAARAAGARVVVTTHAASLGFLCERGTLLQYGEQLCDGLVAPAKCAACALQHRGVPLPVARALAHSPLPLARMASALPGAAGTALGYPALIAENQRRQQRMFDAVSAFVVLSDWAAKVLIDNGAPAGKVVVNRLGVRSTNGRHAARRERGDIVAGFIGRAEPIKGLDVAVRAVRSLDPVTPIRLRVIASARSGDERDFLGACLDLSGGDPRITFEAAIAPERVAGTLAEFDVLLSPSRVVEGGPTIALEALAAGTPVIGSALPALTEIISDGINGRLHPPGDWQALASALTAVARDPAALARWRAAPHQPRTMDDVTAEYLELYAAVCHHGRDEGRASAASTRA